MKRILFSLVAIATISLSSFGQAPEGFKYQAVLRDAGNTILNNQAVGMRMTIQQGSIGGTTVYQETFAPTTNGYGLVNLEIGSGTVVSGTFATIDWAAGPYFIETAVDVTGGISFVVMGTSELMSVPYALYAKTAENVTNDLVDDADADPNNEIQAVSFSNDTLYLSNGGQVYLGAYGIDLVDDADADAMNEIQDLQLLGNILTITNNGTATSIDLSGYLDNTDTQLDETAVDGFVVNNGYITNPDDADADPNNEIQVVSFANDTLYLSNGGQVYLGTYRISSIIISHPDGNIGINSTGATPNASAMLDIVSSTKGLLIPRMTNAQKKALNPLPADAQGLLIYQTDGSEGLYYNTSITTTPIWNALQNFVDLTTLQNNINGAKTFLVNVTVPTLNTLTVGLGPGTGNATNTAIGVSALAGNTTAPNVTAVGYQAAMGNTTGGSTVAIGYQALMANTTGVSNTATGSQALFTTTTGGFNTAYGNGALYTTTGIGNTATGYHSLYSNAAGSSNTALGNLSGYDNGAGTQNTYIGYNTGRGITSGTNNTILGANVIGLPAALANNIILANGAGLIKAQHDAAHWTLTDNIQFGSYGAGTLTTDAAGNITASSDERLKDINGDYKKGLAELLSIKPIVYHWNELSGNDTLNAYAGFSAQNIKESIPEGVGIDPKGYLTLSDRPILAATVNAIKEINSRLNEITDGLTDTKKTGLIVKDIEKTYPEVIITDSNGSKTIDYDKLTTLLIGGMKEQQHTITGQQLAIEKMETEMLELKTMVMSLTK